jgi:hypothetical protein
MTTVLTQMLCYFTNKFNSLNEDNEINYNNTIDKATNILYKWLHNKNNWIETKYKNDKGLNYYELKLSPFYTNCDYDNTTKELLYNGISDSISCETDTIFIHTKIGIYDVIKVSYKDNYSIDEIELKLHDYMSIGNVFIVNPDWILSQQQMSKEIIYKKIVIE